MAVSSLFFHGYTVVMAPSIDDLLTPVERKVKESFEEKSGLNRLPSTAADPPRDQRHDQLVLPLEERGKMPYTKDKYIIRENPNLVEWERELRKFLRNLTPIHGHRVSAVMVYEWATGLSVKDLMAEEARQKQEMLDAGLDPRSRRRSSWRSDLRKLNQLLREYFGKPYMTYIMGRKVAKAYRIPAGWRVYYHRPKTVTLYAEWASGIKL